MDNRRRLPPDGGGEANLSISAIHAEPVCERVRRDAGDPVTSTRTAKEEMSGVPCKVPRFQYVDFPSLHQCIKQLSVPPLEGWLASCPLAKASACQSSGTRERAPKFKYVDYPSLYHCIQQLSVPPLEIWSSGLTRPSPGCQSPSRPLGYQRGSGEAQEAVAGQLRDAPPCSDWERGGGGCLDLDHTSQTCSAPRSESGSRGESGPRAELEGVASGNEKVRRPSVISMAHSTRRKHCVTPAERVQRPSNPAAHGKQQANEESVCPSSGLVLLDLEGLQSQQRSPKDETPH